MIFFIRPPDDKGGRSIGSLLLTFPFFMRNTALLQKKQIVIKDPQKTTKKLIKRGVSCFYNACDFLTVRISENSIISQKLLCLVDNSNTYVFDFGELRLVYSRSFEGGKMRLYDLLDNQANKC